MQKGKRLSEEALQIGKEEKRKEKDIRKGIPISMQSSKVKKKKGVIRQPSSVTNAKK